jgi:glutathione S-transferase
MLELHIANKNYSSWSLRPWLLLRELGIPFHERLHPFVPGGEAFRVFSPSGKVPLLVDGDLRIWESLSIVEYLAERHPGVWPGERAARAWARSAASEMHAGFTALRASCSMSCGVRVRLHEISPLLQRDIARLEELWLEGLGRFGGPFLTGATFSAVDGFYAPVAFRFQTYGLPLTAAARAYAERLLALPSMQAWYADALEEPYREKEHDEEVLKSGTLLADHRTMSRIP